MKYLILLILAICVSFNVVALERKCIIPPPDTDLPGQAEPVIVGKIFGVKKDTISISTAQGARYFVDLDESTGLITVYGGGVETNQIMVGQHVFVWLKNCILPKKGARNPAVLITFCSIDSEPCPKG